MPRSKQDTTPLYLQSDVMVERYIRTVEECLQKIITFLQRDWDVR
jgi:hypothetical protein